MKKKILAAVLAALLTLCACSGTKQNEEHGQDIGEELQAVSSAGLDWQITERKLPAMAEPDNMPEGTWVNEILCEMAGETIYGLGGITGREDDDILYDVGYVVEKMEYPYEKWEICTYKGVDEWLEGERCSLWYYPWATALSEDGTLSMLFDGAKYTYLCRWKDGEYSLSEPLSEDEKGLGNFNFGETFMIKDMLVYENGDIHLANTTPFAINTNGKFLSEVEWGGGYGYVSATERLTVCREAAGTVLCVQENPFISVKSSPDGTLVRDFIYLFGNTSDGSFYVQNWEENQPQLIDDTVTMEEDDRIVWISENSGYLCNRTRIWKFETGTGLVQEAVVLPDYGYVIDKILDCRMGNDGKLVLLVSVDGQKLLLELEGEVNGGKTIMELAVHYPDAVLRRAVIRFNRSNKEYAVEIRQAEKGETEADFRTRIQAELAAGKGPDLLSDDAIADMEMMAGKGQVLELTEFFEEEDMLPNVWQCGKVGTDLYAVPYTYSIQTLITTKEMAGGRTGWTVEELVECVRKSGVEQFCSSFEGDTLFWHLCGGDGIDTDIMDWENKTCHFDSMQAKELLEFAGKYSGETDYVMSDIKLLEGESFVTWGLMIMPQDFSSRICKYQDSQVYIGYPTVDGGSGHILDPDMVAVNSVTEHKDGAAAFVQYLVSEEWQEYMAESVCGFKTEMKFPVRRQALEHLYGYLLNVPPEEGEKEDENAVYYEYTESVIIGDYEFPTLPFTEENVGQMRTVIETASSRRAGSLTILDIITEETEGFFAGNKSADEVLSVLQNRIQLYLDERN